MRIRIATGLDADDVRRVHLRAFPAGERQIVSRLATDLLREITTPPTISLVAEIEDMAVGHVAFSPLVIDHNENFKGYILAPLGVKPDYQRRHIGSKLIESGMRRLSRMGAHILFVYGDPDYYRRFGFSKDAAQRYTPPYKIQYPFGWQAISLNRCPNVEHPIRLACVPSLCDQRLW